MMKEDLSTREALINRIEAAYPPDSEDGTRAEVGTLMMERLFEAYENVEGKKTVMLFSDPHAWAQVYDPGLGARLRLSWRTLPLAVLLAAATAMESEAIVHVVRTRLLLHS